MSASEAAKISNLSPEDQMLYEMSERGKYDMELVEETAKFLGEQRGVKVGIEKGMKVGMEKGMEKGKIKNQVETILAAHLDGFTAQQISNFTRMPLDKILVIIGLYNKNKDYEQNVADILKELMPESEA